MEFLNDEYTLEIDDLGYKQQAENVRKIIMGCETPYAIGISGRWGSGKTSLMKYIMASLGGKPLTHRLKYQTDLLKNDRDEIKFKTIQNLYSDYESIQTIWFNPWEHEHHDEPFVELLKEIKKHFELLCNIKEEVKKLSAVSIQAGLDMLGSFLKTGSNQGSSIKDIGEKYEYENFEYENRSQRFKLIFEKAIEKLLTPSKKGGLDARARLVIFIDDLDRCEEDTIAKLLKEIKQYLSTRRCVFVFGYDKHHVEKALSGSIKRSSKETRAYLEKLFQSTILIRQPDEEKIINFTYNRLASEHYKFISEKCKADFVNFIVPIIDPNPRRIKNFLTALYLHVNNSSFSNKAISYDDLKRLALITYLKVFYEPVYSALENKYEILSDLISVLKNRDRLATKSHREYFLYLELRSHIHDLDVEMDSDRIKEEFRNDEASERKLLSEIYEMQGRHKSYEKFMIEFVNCFQPIVESKQFEEIHAYL